MPTNRRRSIRSRIGWPGLALLVLALSYLGFLIAGLPAATLWRSLEPRLDLPPDLAVNEVFGTAWSGRVGSLHWNGQDVGTLVWRWRASALLRGGLGLQLTWNLDAAGATGQFLLRPNRIEGRDLQGRLPAAPLQRWLDLPLLLAGEIHVAVEQLVWRPDQGVVAAAGTLLWADAAMGLPQPMPLGTLRAGLSVGDPGQLRLDLASAPEAPVQISGHVIWLPPQDYQTDMHLLATGSATATLRTALSQIGAPQPDGSRRVLESSQGFPR